jgi:N-acylneuraminate cytidylyltransferase
MNNIAIIPARAGSKRIPGKNLIDFGGIPLIEWTLKAALQSEVFKVIIIDTDDMDIYQKYNYRYIDAQRVQVRLRSLESASDDITPVHIPVLQRLDALKSSENQTFDTVTLLMATSPLRSHLDIQNAHMQFNRMYRNRSLFQISAYEVPNHAWGMYKGPSGEAIPINDIALKARSQELKSVYLPTGAVWIADYDALMEHKTFYGPGYSLYVMNEINAIDIDTPQDLIKAEAYLEVFKKKGW